MFATLKSHGNGKKHLPFGVNVNHVVSFSEGDFGNYRVTWLRLTNGKNEALAMTYKEVRDALFDATAEYEE